MNFEKEKIKEKYQKLLPKFNNFGRKIEKILNSNLQEESILHLPIEYRVKSFESFLKKVHDKKYFDNPFEKITDLLGIRIITYFSSDLEKVNDIILNQFTVIEGPNNKKDLLKISEFGYRSIHYLVKIDPKRKNLQECDDFSDLIAEIQIRTIIQHAWAEIEHNLIYKPKFPNIKLDSPLNRRLKAIAAMLEIADKEYDSIKEGYENNVYAILKGVDLEDHIKRNILEISKFEDLILEDLHFLVKNEKYELILDLVNKILEKDPNSINALFYKGITFLMVKEYEKAILYFKRVIQINSGHEKALHNIGLCLQKVNKFDESIKYYEKTLEINSKNFKAWNNMAISFMKLEEYNVAIIKYNQALELNPNNKVNWNNKGICLKMIDEYEEALKCQNRALDIDSKYIKALIEKGNCLASLCDFEGSIECYKDVLKINKNYAKAFYNIACIKSLQNNKEESLRFLENALKINVEFKKKAKMDRDFKKISDSEEFKQLVDD